MDSRDWLVAGAWTAGWSGVTVGVGLLVVQLILLARVRGRWWALLGPLLAWLACNELWWLFVNSISCGGLFGSPVRCLNGSGEPAWAPPVWFVLLAITELITLGVGVTRLVRWTRENGGFNGQRT